MFQLVESVFNGVTAFLVGHVWILWVAVVIQALAFVVGVDEPRGSSLRDVCLAVVGLVMAYVGLEAYRVFVFAVGVAALVAGGLTVLRLVVDRLVGPSRSAVARELVLES